MKRPCPECQTTMQEVLDRGVEVDRCMSGHGLHFDRGEVQRFIGGDSALDARLLAAATRQATRSTWSCAGCQRPMMLFQSAMLAAHLCQYCGGTWLEGRYLAEVDSLLALPGREVHAGPRAVGGLGAPMGMGAMGLNGDLGGGLGREIGAEAAYAVGEVAVDVAIDAGGSILELLGGLIGGLLDGL